VALGVATFVGVLSMSAAADAQVERRIAAHRPELLTVRSFGSSEEAREVFDDTMLDRVAAEPSFEHGAIVQTYAEVPVRARLGSDDEQVRSAPVMGVEGDLITATRSDLQGSSFDGPASRGDSHVALLGRGIADRLGVSDPSLEPAIWVSGVPFRVLGIIADSKYLAGSTDAVVIPRRTAFRLFAEEQPEGVLYVRVTRGTADTVADRLPLRLTPSNPERWAVEVPRVPLDVAEAISADVRNLSLAMAALVMFIGVVAIANAMMRAVYERMTEFGLRRSLGARGSHVLGLLVAESAQVGMVAGILGAIVGLSVALAVATHNGWPHVVSLFATALAVPAGTIAGILGGLFPGITAVRVTPSQALRRE
jgi:putative ABC transport system permease protein